MHFPILGGALSGLTSARASDGVLFAKRRGEHRLRAEPMAVGRFAGTLSKHATEVVPARKPRELRDSFERQLGSRKQVLRSFDAKLRQIALEGDAVLLFEER